MQYNARQCPPHAKVRPVRNYLVWHTISHSAWQLKHCPRPFLPCGVSRFFHDIWLYINTYAFALLKYVSESITCLLVTCPLVSEVYSWKTRRSSDVYGFAVKTISVSVVSNAEIFKCGTELGRAREKTIDAFAATLLREKSKSSTRIVQISGVRSVSTVCVVNFGYFRFKGFENQH